MSSRLPAICVFLLIVSAARHAAAQAADEEAILDDSVTPRVTNGASFDPDKAVDPMYTVQGPGWKVNENTTFHPVFGLETGAISNVFYTNNSNCQVAGQCVQAAGFLRALIQVGAGSLSANQLTPSDQNQEDPLALRPGINVQDPGAVIWRMDLRAAYDQMLSGNSIVNDTGGLSLGATGRVTFNAYGPLTFSALEDYERLIRAANYETDVDANRDINNIYLSLPYHPRDRAFSGFLYFDNTIDVFESSVNQFANRTLNVVGVHPTYALFPQTFVTLDVSQGFDTGLGSVSKKVTSYPTALSAGISTLITPFVSVNASIGYTWLNYDTGATTDAVTGGAGVGFRYSEFGRVYLQYARQYADSINANYYQEDVIRAWAYQRFGRLVLSIQPEAHFRTYEGTIVPSITGSMTRNDDIYAIIAGVSYNLKNQLQLALDYRYTDLETDFRYMSGNAIIDPSYERHAVLLGLRAAL